MGFRTKLDYSDNRQIKQHIETLTHLSGATVFGVPFNQLPTGPDLRTSGISHTATMAGSTFYTNNGVTTYDWYDSGMQVGYPYLTAITPSNSGITQYVPSVYTAATTTVIDGNTVALSYTGINFDLTAIAMFDLGNNNYSGTTVSNEVNFLSATTLDFTGRTIWVDVSGITRTQQLIVGGTAQIGDVLTRVNDEGLVEYRPSGGGGGGGNYWTAGTGTDAVMMVNGANEASGSLAIAEGLDTTASGDYSHSEGISTTASGVGSHAEGRTSIASGTNAHAEGGTTIASGDYTHAEGTGTIASGLASHAGGTTTIAVGLVSFVHGLNSAAVGDYSIVLGRSLTGNTPDTTYVDRLNIKTLSSGTSINNLGISASGNIVISAGIGITYWTGGTGVGSIQSTFLGPNGASGKNSLAVGSAATASGAYSMSLGAFTQATGIASHAVGQSTGALGNYSHAEGNTTYAHIQYGHAEGFNTVSSGDAAHCEGMTTKALANASHSEGTLTVANGDSSHAEGFSTTATTFCSHAEGNSTLANNNGAHAEGSTTIANGLGSHAEGRGSIAGGNYSHAGGSGTTASGVVSRAIGSGTTASGIASFSSGYRTIASGRTSFVHGENSIASGITTIVLGSSITGTSNNTVYMQNLNVNTGGTFTIGSTKLDEPTLAIVSSCLSTGLYLFTNGGITTTGTTTFNLGAVKGWIVDSDDVLNANPSFVNYPGGSGLTTPYRLTDPASYVMIDKNSQVVITNVRPNSTQRRDNIYLGAVGHAGNLIDSYGNQPDIIMNEMSQLRAMFEPLRLINEGVIMYPNSTNLTLANTTGVLYGLGIGFIINGNDGPTIINVPAGAPTTVQYRTRNSGAFGNTTLIDPNNSDVGGTVTPIAGSNNQATNQRFYLLEDASIRVQYGQTIYATLADAVSGANGEAFVVFPNNKNLGILIGILSVRKGTTNLSDTAFAKFLPVSKFGESVGSAAGVSTSTLQSAYNNSGEPEIVTNPINLGVAIRRGSGADTDIVFETQNGIGTTTFSINGNGLTLANSLRIANVGVAGTIDLGVNALGDVVNQASDEKLKENVIPIQDALEKVKKLRGVSYQWKDKLRGGDAPRLGFIAQEVALVEPMLVTQIGAGLLGVNYRDATALLSEAIKELSAKMPLVDKIIKDDELLIPRYTPTSSADKIGLNGSLCRDEDYLYMKTNTGWKRTKFENF